MRQSLKPKFGLLWPIMGITSKRKGEIMSGIEPMWDFVESLDHKQLEMLENAITFHMSRHIERGRSEEDARERWADLLKYFVEGFVDMRQGLQAHG